MSMNKNVHVIEIFIFNEFRTFVYLYKSIAFRDSLHKHNDVDKFSYFSPISLFSHEFFFFYTEFNVND